MELQYFGNSVTAWLYAGGMAVGVLLGLMLLRTLVISRLRSFSARTVTQMDDLALEVLNATKAFFLAAIALLAASTVVDLMPRTQTTLNKLIAVAVVIQGGFWVASITREILKRYRNEQQANNPSGASMLGVVSFLVQVAVWSGVILLALDNFGVDITALIAGLGVGGIAVALALQNVLSDLFASLAIVIDKPFVIGDFITVDTLRGTVEAIGLKTTRVRALGGEELIFSNADLLSSRVHNFQRMRERRAVFTIGVIYQTPRALLEKVPDIIRTAIEAQSTTRFDRSHLSGYGAYSIDFETAWYVLSPEYPVFMDVQQAIYLAIHEQFEEHGIQFAYPTQTLFMERD